MIENLKNDCGTLMTGIKLEYWQDVFREKNDLYVIIGEKDTAKKVEAKHENAYGFIVDN